MGKTFEKQIKTIEDQGEKQVEALKNLKPKEQIKAIEGESNNQSKASVIFNDLVKKRMDIINKLYESVDYNNLTFNYVGSTKDVRFYEFMDFKDLFNKIRNNQITFSDAQEKQKLFLNKLNNVKIGKRMSKQKEVITNLENFYKSREEFFNFFKDYTKMYIDVDHKAKQNKTELRGLKILTSRQMLQRLPIAIAQVKAGNNSENLLNEIRQIVYSLYQSKQITKKTYNHIIESIK